jgi:hypothetical protein
MDSITTILIALVVIILVIGLVKKVLWLCVVAAIIGCGLFVMEPNTLDNISSSVSSFFGGAISPFEDNDYSDLINDDVETTPNKTYEDIGKGDGT